ncbi:hypothetical protein FQZ97_1134040 [compost metagenome]
MLAMAGPEIIHILDAHRLERKARVAQALHHQFLAIGIHRRHGRTADQVAGELQGRREVGVGRHGKLRKAGKEITVHVGAGLLAKAD